MGWDRKCPTDKPANTSAGSGGGWTKCLFHAEMHIIC